VADTSFKVKKSLNIESGGTLDSSGDLGVASNKLRFHNGTTASDVVTAAHTETLTNKTIDADSNTISNIDNADIKAGAAIARTKLASGTADHVLINDGSGVMSSEASLAISRGGTGQTTASAAFDALSPITTKGDLIVGDGANSTARLAVGTNGFVLTADSAEATGVKWAAAGSPTEPLTTKYLSGTGTHTITGSPLYIIVEMVGGGGGGAASGSAGANNGTNGGASTFGTALLSAGGGSGATATAAGGGSGGTSSLGTGPVGIALSGADGNGSFNSTINSVFFPGGSGGSSYFGGAGAGLFGSAGGSAKTNSGSGGGGGGTTTTSFGGGGGGAGGYVRAKIDAADLDASYDYEVGSAGLGGGAGTNGFNGGDGAAGMIIVTEYYQ
jgi:hypothetical protein